jgi:acetylornithine deacetylase/succinyl-diaminopimelate desuccinylase-like protein
MTWNESEWVATVSDWIACEPTRDAPMERRERVATAIATRLSSLGFDVVLDRRSGLAPTIIATRGIASDRATLAIYNHYDVEPAFGDWRTPPNRLVLTDERYFGAGVADNLGALGLRLLAAQSVRSWPAVLWVIEGGEEEGSPGLDAVASLIDEVRPSLWIDETGFFVADRAQRVLCIERDRTTERPMRALATIAQRSGLPLLCERRRMNRVSPAGVSRIERVMRDASYLALGPNDERANIHRPNESLPRWALELCAAQWRAVLQSFEEVGS